MSDRITITGLVATQPRHIVTSEGLPITSFRLASTQRRFDTAAEKWIDGETNWYTVTAFRQLATHTAESVDKGDRILVVGKLRIREWESDERTATNIEVEADAIGHDLSWGTGVFTRSVAVAIPAEPEEIAAPTAVGATQD
jgi:single-strand DNA-binding protein